MKNLHFTGGIKAALLLGAVCALFGFGLAVESRAGDVSVTATLSDDSTVAGEPVDLTVEIKGATSGQVPNKITADGLTITFNGQQHRMEWVNGVVTQSVSCDYAVQADKAGKFTIPAITVTVNGANYSTQPITLSVTAGGGKSGGTAGAAPDAQAETRYAFAELIAPEQTAYVGEAIPLEARFYFDQRARFGQLTPPDIKSEGFTIQKLADPQQQQVEKNGRNYTVVIFKTAVTPAKSGKLTLGPAELQCVAQLPQQQRAPRRTPRGVDDFFNDNLFNQMMSISPPQQVSVKSDPINFEVKPLPTAGQPANFEGAVGQFTLATDASPLKVNVGDPITLKLKVSGRGNFDRVTAPRIADERGWRAYPPSGKFTADDDVGISGSKTFELAVIPNEKKTKTPGIEFSYFDPVNGKYVTLKGDRPTITVEGAAPPVPVVQATPSPTQPSSAQDTAKRANDIQYIMTGPAHWVTTFTPLFRQPVFWEAQAAPALALVGLIGFQARRKKARDLLARQLAEWRREQQGLMKILQRENADPAEFYDAATRYVQIAAARASHGARLAPESIGPGEALAALPLDEATGEGVQSIFNTHGELRYAGVGATGRKLADARRQEVLETLRKFQDAQE